MAPYATGSCLCGAIQYTIASAPTFTYLCHCPSCKKSSGSAFMHNIAVTSAAFTLTPTTSSTDTASTPSAVRTYNDTNTKSGKPLKRSFCGECGSPVKIETEMNPGKVFLPAGLLEDGVEVEPEREHWPERRVSWFEGLKERVGKRRRKG